MTEHDEKKDGLVVLRRGLNQTEPHGALFRLAVFFLVALLLLAGLMVGSSFSKIISKGTISGFTFTADGFNIYASETYTVNGVDYDSGSLDGRDATAICADSEKKEPYIICSFEVTNDSRIDALLDMVITTEYVTYADPDLSEVAFYLYIYDEDNSFEEYQFDKTGEENTGDGTVTVKDYPLKKAEEDGTPVTIEFVFIIAHNGSGYPNNLTLTTGDVTITAKQAKEPIGEE